MVEPTSTTAAKHAKPVAGNAAAGLKIGLSPLLDGLTGEACDAAELEVARVTFGVERNRWTWHLSAKADRLVLAEKVKAQEPRRQRQLRVLEKTARGQRGLQQTLFPQIRCLASASETIYLVNSTCLSNSFVGPRSCYFQNAMQIAFVQALAHRLPVQSSMLS